MTRGRARSWLKVLAAAVFLATATAGGVWVYRVEVATRVATDMLEQQGLGPVQLSIRSVGLHSARANDVSLYGGALRAKTLVLQFQPGDLYAGRAEAIEIEGLRAAIAIGDNGLTVGGRTLPLQPSAGSSGMPVGSITLRDADITATVPGIAQPVHVSGNGRLAETTLSFEGTARIEADKGSVLEVLAAGRHDIASNAGTASITMRTLKFHRTSKQPQDLLPALAGVLPPIDGEARAAGIVSWQGAKITPDIVLHVSGISFDTSQAKVSALEADLHIRQFAPLATDAHQVLTASIKPGSLPASALSLQFELQAKPAIRVEALSSEFAGGKITATPFVVDPAQPAIDTVLHFSAVELDRALHLLNVDGLAGTGRIGGDVGLHLRNGKLTMDKSRLAATGPGELNITNRWLSDKIGESNQTVHDALLTLGDFHYDVLTLEVERAESGQGYLILHLEGQSPTAAVLKGQRIVFNIRLDSNFDRLTELAVQSIAATHQLLRQR